MNELNNGHGLRGECYMTRLNLAESNQNRSNHWEEIFHLIGSWTDDEDRDLSLDKILLVRDTFAHCEKNFITSGFSLPNRRCALRAQASDAQNQ